MFSNISVYLTQSRNSFIIHLEKIHGYIFLHLHYGQIDIVSKYERENMGLTW